MEQKGHSSHDSKPGKDHPPHPTGECAARPQPFHRPHCEDADPLLIEALTDKGVVATPLAKYRWHNIRVCQPLKIDLADLDRVINSVIADLSKEYDNRNFFELTLLLLCPVRFGPMKTWTIQTCLGNCTEHQVICLGMIAQVF